MNETAKSARPAAATLECVALDLPPHWDGQRTIHVTDEEGNEAQMTAEACLVRPLRRAALLAQHGLCSRIDLGLDSSSLHIVRVYWED